MIASGGGGHYVLELKNGESDSNILLLRDGTNLHSIEIGKKLTSFKIFEHGSTFLSNSPYEWGQIFFIFYVRGVKNDFLAM